MTSSAAAGGTRLGVALVLLLAASLSAFTFLGLQGQATLFFTVGGCGLLGSLALFLVLFRRLFDRQAYGWLQLGMLLISIHAIFLVGEAALRVADRARRRSQEARKTFILNEYLPFFRDEAGYGRIHTSQHPITGLGLVPNTSTRFLDCPISINSDGFRGREIGEKQPDELRVMCLGASTTFGWTVGAADRTYPEVLEELLSTKLEQPVTVINAGVAGLRVDQNAMRLEMDLLRFAPDVIVVYHGFSNIPSGIGGDVRLRPRASLLFQQALVAHAVSQAKLPLYGPVYQKRFRAGLEKIASICQAEQIGLVLCSFALAFDRDTPRAEMEFFESLMPMYDKRTGPLSALSFVEINNGIVRDAAQRFGAEFVDVASVLGGRYEHFLDFAHFDQEGRDILAATIEPGVLRAAQRRHTGPMHDP